MTNQYQIIENNEGFFIVVDENRKAVANGSGFTTKEAAQRYIENKPIFGKQYALTGGTGGKCIANGNTWAESEVKKPIKERIGDYMKLVNELNAEYYEHYKFTFEPAPIASAMYGTKFARIVTASNGRSRGVHSFIDLSNGDILKAAGWKQPAPNGVRGNIYADDCGRSKISRFGAKYINGGMKAKMVELKK